MPERMNQDESAIEEGAQLGQDDAGSGPPSDAELDDVESDDEEVHGGPMLNELDLG